MLRRLLDRVLHRHKPVSEFEDALALSRRLRGLYEVQNATRLGEW
jgi:hypothetical protein